MEHQKQNRILAAVVDLETLGVGTKKLILSVGIAFGDLATRQVIDTMHIEFDVTSQLKEFDIDAGTLAFWLGQKQDARDAVIRQLKRRGIPRDIAMQYVCDYIKSLPNGTRVVGNGPLFDLGPIAQFSGEDNLPWQFWAERNLRDWLDICKLVTGVDVKRNTEFEGIQHHALDDAKHEFKLMAEVYHTLMFLTRPVAVVDCGKTDASEIEKQLEAMIAVPGEVRPLYPAGSFYQQMADDLKGVNYSSAFKGGVTDKPGIQENEVAVQLSDSDREEAYSRARYQQDLLNKGGYGSLKELMQMFQDYGPAPVEATPTIGDGPHRYDLVVRIRHTPNTVQIPIGVYYRDDNTPIDFREHFGLTEDSDYAILTLPSEPIAERHKATQDAGAFYPDGTNNPAYLQHLVDTGGRESLVKLFSLSAAMRYSADNAPRLETGIQTSSTLWAVCHRSSTIEDPVFLVYADSRSEAEEFIEENFDYSMSQLHEEFALSLAGSPWAVEVEAEEEQEVEVQLDDTEEHEVVQLDDNETGPELAALSDADINAVAEQAAYKSPRKTKKPTAEDDDI